MDRTHSEPCHNHIIIITDDLMAFIKKTSGFLQESSSAVSHHVYRVIDGENKLYEIWLIYSWKPSAVFFFYFAVLHFQFIT